MLGELRKSRLFLAGAAVLAVGLGPLLLYLLYEAVTGTRGGNPVGLGLLAFVSFWPGVLLLAAGLITSALRARGGGR